jgi:hypothetical protein
MMAKPPVVPLGYRNVTNSNKKRKKAVFSIIQILLDPPAILVTIIGLIAPLDSTVTNSIRHPIVTIGHPVTHDTILSHQVTVANKIIGLIAKVTTKIGPLAIQIDLASHKVTNQVVTIPMLLVTTRIGPPPAVVTPVTGPLAVQIVRVTMVQTVNKTLVTNIGIEAVPPTVTDLRLILVTANLGKITLVTVSKIRVTIGHKVTVVTVLPVIQEIISQVKIVLPIISLMVTNSALNV